MTNRLFFVASLALVSIFYFTSRGVADPRGRLNQKVRDEAIDANSIRMLTQGRDIFRNNTFGDEVFWGDTIKLHQAVAGAANGGVGPGVSPKTALAVGLKVDANQIPDAVAQAIAQGKVNLDDPATTLTLLKLDAVIGVKGHFDATGKITSMGVTCALAAGPPPILVAGVAPAEVEGLHGACAGLTRALGARA